MSDPNTSLVQREERSLARISRRVMRRVAHALAVVPVLGQAITSRLLIPRHSFDETHVVPTDDGAHVALHRYLPRGPRRGNPIILCHGIACNRHFWDISPERSFAQALASAGRDVWVLEMRGHGQSHRVPALEPWKAIKVRWDFDHYVHHDLPAAINFVRDRGSSKKVDWIGHSMGGMVIYAHLGTTAGDDVENLITIGSPTFIDNRFWAWKVAGVLSGPASLIPHFPVRLGAWAVSGAVLALHPFVPNPVYSKENMSPRDAAMLFHNVLDDISGGEVSLGIQFIKERGFRSRDGKISYAERLKQIKHPALLLAGSRDFLVMPRDVRAAFDRISSEDKTLHILGKKQGYTHDYGHADLVLGRFVKTEVVPIVLDWLEERTGD